MDRQLVQLKYLSGIAAVITLILALLPAGVVAGLAPPTWAERALFLAQCVLLAIVAYGLHARRPIYWTLTPILVALCFLTILVPALWSAIELSLPLFPFVIMAVALCAFAFIFLRWWRTQRGYFVGGG